MPIDVDAVVGARLEPTSYSWSEDDLILYNLGVGAGDPPDDPDELKYAYEADLVAVPTFGTIPPFSMMMGIGAVAGLDIDFTKVLHGEQTLEIHAPIPTEGRVTQEGSIVDVWDKGSGALIVLEIVSRLGDGAPLFTNRSGIFARGEGGFGGDPGQSSQYEFPARDPDFVSKTTTLPQQALLYRMVSGDKNPLHADPAFSALGGFERPILHGLCTYGVACKTVTEAALEGEPSRLAGYSARFTGHVFPGETLVTRMWNAGEDLLIRTSTEDRDTGVLEGAVRTRS